MEKGVCVVCAGSLLLPDDCAEGEILVCADCGTELEVISMNPAKLEEAPEIQEE